MYRKNMYKLSSILKALLIMALSFCSWLYFLTIGWEDPLYVSPIMNLVIPSAITIILFMLAWKFLLSGLETLIAFSVLIVSSVVIFSALSSCRGCGGAQQNRHIIRDLAMLRTRAEVVYSDHGESYVYGAIPVGDCYSSDLYNEGMFADEEIKSLLEAIKVSAKANPKCVATKDAYAVSVPIILLGELRSWCADSTGFSGEIAAPITKVSCK